MNAFQKLLLAVVPVLAAAALGASTASSALVCLPTTYQQDGRPLTAALIDPASVPENLDATGCDIGVYYDSGTHALTDRNIFGSTYYGVLSNGAGVVTNIDHSSVYDVGDHPHDGAQHGIDVAYRNGADGSLDSSQIYDYQKGGVLADGAGTSVSVTNNVVRGLGPVPFIAQNGVQVSRGATGNVNGNFIEDNEYTGCSKADAKSTGCTYTDSTGILLFQVDQSLVDTNNNTYRDNDVNLFNGSNQ
jgi:hypothetical protein